MRKSQRMIKKNSHNESFVLFFGDSYKQVIVIVIVPVVSAKSFSSLYHRHNAVLMLSQTDNCLLTPCTLTLPLTVFQLKLLLSVLTSHLPTKPFWWVTTHLLVALRHTVQCHHDP